MSRPLLTLLAALVFGATSWAVFGLLAALAFSRMPGGAREGGGAMAGFFFAGPVCGLIGAAGGAWLVWRLLANPGWNARVGFGLVALLLTLIAGALIALQPTRVTPGDYPGQKARLVVEVSFPSKSIAPMSSADRVTYEMRSGDGTDVTPWQRGEMRIEGGRTIVPGVFPVRARPRTKLLAVMKNDRQMMCSTLTIEDGLDATTGWSPWQDMEAGFSARWRLIVTSTQAGTKNPG